MFLIRRFLIGFAGVFLMLVSLYSFADTYFWYGSGNSHSLTPEGACRTGDLGTGKVLTLVYVPLSDHSGRCDYTYVDSNGKTQRITGDTVNRTTVPSPPDTDPPAGTGSGADGDLLAKCQAAAGGTVQNFAWEQVGTDIPAAPSYGGCATTLGSGAICHPNDPPNGKFNCTGNIMVKGELFVAPPDNSSTPGTGTGTGTGTGGSGTGSTGSGDTGTGDTGGTGSGDSGGSGSSGGSSGGSGGTGSGNSGTGTGSGGTGTGGGSGNTGTGTGTGSGNTGTGTGSGGTGTGGGSGTGTGDGDGDGGDSSSPSTTSLTKPQHGNMDDWGDEWDQKIEDAKGDFKDGLDKLKDSFQPVGDINLGSGGGKLFCPPPVTVLGKSLSFCMDKYSGSLSWIAQAILFLCAATALMIVFV